jgi:hypothetical protein
MPLQQAIIEFKGQFRGVVIEPEDAAYDEARKVYNGMIDRRPRLIAKCTDAADVMAAVRMAKTNGLRVSIRGGGHNATALTSRLRCGGSWKAALCSSMSAAVTARARCTKW